MDGTELTLSYDPGESWLSVSVTSKGFSGETGYVAWEDELRAFLGALKEYPITAPIALALGEREDRRIVAITVSPSNGRGGLRVAVELRDNLTEESDRYTSINVYTVYPELDEFCAALLRIVRSGGTISLKGE